MTLNVNTQEYLLPALAESGIKERKRKGGARAGRPRGTSGNFREVRYRFGQRVMRLRLDRGLSQEEVGKYFNLTKQAWGEIERGGISVTLDRLQEVATYFKVPIESLVAVDELNSDSPMDLFDKFKILWGNIPQERRQYLYDIGVLFEQQSVTTQPETTE